MPAPPPAARKSAPAVRTLGGRPRTDQRSDARDDPREGGAGSSPRLADTHDGGPDDAEATVEPSAEGEAPGDADRWEAVATAAVRTVLRAVRAADAGWSEKLDRVAADPGVRSALNELADAARRAAGPASTGEAAASSQAGPASSSAESAPAEPASPPSRRSPSVRVAAPPPASRPEPKVEPSQEPVATLGEIQQRLTLGEIPSSGFVAATPAASPGASAGARPGPEMTLGADASTLRSEDVRDLPRVPDRCRAKAEALRWAADRLQAGAETGPLRTRREALEAAADPGEALWPLSEPAPPGAAPADYLQAAAVFEVLADAATLLDAALERYFPAAESTPPTSGRGEELEGLKAALDMTAEAQSMALLVVRALRERPDRDQVAVYKTIRDISDARSGIAYFIRNFLREGSHADPTAHADLAARIAASSAARGRGKAEREAFKKFAHAAAKAAAHADDEAADRFEYHTARMEKFASRLLGLGVPPSDVRFREAVSDDPAPLRTAARRLADGEADAVPPALAKVLEYLPSPEPPTEEEADDAPTSQYADSVDAALARIREEFPDALAFALNSKSVAEGYPYQHPDRVYLGLKFLATTLRDALSGRVPCPDLGEECVRQCGLRYSPNQSASTMGQFPEDYRTRWNGEEVPLTRHLRGGNNKDPRLSIRLAFHYDREEDVVVIGYLGQHQRTRAS